jgi:spore coat polysaccharide biosynthesis predicted glycosyltransferase SpsG
LAYLGVPTILISVADNQLNGCQHAQDHNYSIYAGHWKSMKPEILAPLFARLLEDNNWRIFTSKNAQAHIDGSGADRVLCEIFRPQMI